MLLVICLALLSACALNAPQRPSSDGSASPTTLSGGEASARPPEIHTLLLSSTTLSEQKSLVRTLLDRLGPEAAQDELYRSGLVFTGQTHLLIHAVGDYLYEKFGPGGIRHCKPYFLGACYHGLLMRAIADHGPPVVVDAWDQCREAGRATMTQCAHGAGHGLLAWGQYDLVSALSRCDELEREVPEFTSFNCYDGVFMENIWRLHGHNHTAPQLLSHADLDYPCSDPRLDQRHLPACWGNQVTWLYEVFGGALPKVASRCEQLVDTKSKESCFNGLARQIHPLTKGSADEVFRLCLQAAAGPWYGSCLMTIAESAFAVGDQTRMPFEICARIDQMERRECYARIFALIALDALPKMARAEELCSNVLEPLYRDECMQYQASLMASTTPTTSAQGQSTSVSEERGVRGLYRHAEEPTVVDTVIEAENIQTISQQQGAQRAYEYLKQQWQNNQIAGHDLAHVIGRLAYQQLGDKGFGICDANFGFGCYHGLMATLIKQQGDRGIETARRACNSLVPRGQAISCIHGIGHGIMGSKGEVLLAVSTCQGFPSEDKPYCFDGVFMEYYTSILKGEVQKPAVAGDKPWQFCSSVPKEAQTQCVRNQTVYMLYIQPEGYRDVAASCMTLASDLQPFCTHSFGLIATQRSQDSTDKVIEMCSAFTKASMRNDCIIAGAQEFVFQNQYLQLAYILCSSLNKSDKEKCEAIISRDIE
jgi:hypothetical protein